MEPKHSNSFEFINLHSKIEQVMIENLHWEINRCKIHHPGLVDAFIRKNPEFKVFKEDLLLYNRLRNALAHNVAPDDLNNKDSIQKIDPIAEPHLDVIVKYQELIKKFEHPPKILDYAVPVKNLCVTYLDRSVFEVMKIMNKKTFTHVPVLDNRTTKNMIGVFSENTVFSYISEINAMPIKEKLIIEDFIDFIPVNKHPSEFFEFVSPSTNLYHTQALFQEYLKNQKRLAVVFITDNGKENGSLLGMVTAWDIAGKI